METSADGLVGQVVDGRYRVIALLARGGMATVYEALDTRLDRVVALKVMHRSLAEDPGFVERFQREARSAARLSHPHVVGVFDQGEADGLVYLAMEYVPGRTLRDVIRQYGPLTSEQALTILDPVVEALAAAHAAGFVHRDVKPENVLISNDGRIKVADFGLARALESDGSATTHGLLIGTVAYLSPEQVEHGKADGRSDVYAAGILLFEMVTGKVPYAAENPLSVAYQHVNSDVPAPSSVVATIPAEVDALVTSATRRDPDARYATAGAFLADIRRVRSMLPPARPFADSRDTLIVDAQLAAELQEATAAAQPATPQRAPKPKTQRRKVAPIVAAIALVIAVAAAAFAGWYFSAGPGRTVPMIDVVGLNVADAKAKAAEAGLAVEVSGEEFSETVERDLIVSSDPAPDGNIQEGGTIGVFLSKGPERYDVPDVVGLSTTDATAAIEAANLAVAGTSEAFDDKVAAGLIAGTEPKIGTPSPPDTPILLLISKGPKPVEIPDLVNSNAKKAIASLENSGLTVDQSEKFSETIDKGRIISTSPKAGKVVDSGSTISVVISKGPPPVTVPNLVDMSRETAIATLQRLGLKVNVQEAAFTPLNRVYSQDPKPGTSIPKGSTVTIRII